MDLELCTGVLEVWGESDMVMMVGMERDDPDILNTYHHGPVVHGPVEVLTLSCSNTSAPTLPSHRRAEMR